MLKRIIAILLSISISLMSIISSSFVSVAAGSTSTTHKYSDYVWSDYVEFDDDFNLVTKPSYDSLTGLEQLFVAVNLLSDSDAGFDSLYECVLDGCRYDVLYPLLKNCGFAFGLVGKSGAFLGRIGESLLNALYSYKDEFGGSGISFDSDNNMVIQPEIANDVVADMQISYVPYVKIDNYNWLYFGCPYSQGVTVSWWGAVGSSWSYSIKQCVFSNDGLDFYQYHYIQYLCAVYNDVRDFPSGSGAGTVYSVGRGSKHFSSRIIFPTEYGSVNRYPTVYEYYTVYDCMYKYSFNGYSNEEYVKPLVITQLATASSNAVWTCENTIYPQWNILQDDTTSNNYTKEGESLGIDAVTSISIPATYGYNSVVDGARYRGSYVILPKTATVYDSVNNVYYSYNDVAGSDDYLYGSDSFVEKTDPIVINYNTYNYISENADSIYDGLENSDNQSPDAVDNALSTIHSGSGGSDPDDEFGGGGVTYPEDDGATDVSGVIQWLKNIYNFLANTLYDGLADIYYQIHDINTYIQHYLFNLDDNLGKIWDSIEFHFPIFTSSLQSIQDGISLLVADFESVFINAINGIVDNVYDMTGYVHQILNKIDNLTVSGGSFDASDILAYLSDIKSLLQLLVIGQGVDVTTDLLDMGVDEVGDYVGNLYDMVDEVTDSLSDKFPFSVPWDIAALLGLFASDPVTPVFDLPFKIPRIGVDYTFHVDLSDFENVSKICRAVLTCIFIAGLTYLTIRLTRGDGSE